MRYVTQNKQKLQLHLFLWFYSDTEMCVCDLCVRVVSRSEVLPGTPSLSVIYGRLTIVSADQRLFVNMRHPAVSKVGMGLV